MLFPLPHSRQETSHYTSCCGSFGTCLDYMLLGIKLPDGFGIFMRLTDTVLVEGF